MEQEQQILTTGEAAQLCGVSRSTLRRAVAQGQLRAWHTPGKHLRFTREACEEFATSLGRYDLVGRPYGESDGNGQGAEATGPAQGAAHAGTKTATAAQR